MRWTKRGPLGLVLLAVSLPACDSFEPDVTGGPSDLPLTSLVNVVVEYRQPNGCLNANGNCADRVVFFGSWMRPGEEILLDPQPGHLWVGSAANVPVNWPPHVAPHLVRIFDPHLVDTETAGVTALRLTIGRQNLTKLNDLGTPSESGLVYVDTNGIGHNPF